MKKISKRLLSVILAVLLMVTSLPLTFITAFGDAGSDLDATLTTFESYITDIAENGINAIYTGMGDAYEIYMRAVDLRTNGSAAEMVAVNAELTAAMNNMVKFKQAKIDADYEAAHPVKIGNGVNQPLKGSQKTEAMGYGDSDKNINDYDNIIYSDGATASWAQALDTEFNYRYGYPGVDTYRNRVRIYYPNAVILYDGETVPKIPIISAFQGYGTYSDNGVFTADNYRTVVMENIYESTNDVELLYHYWFGTTCGNPFDSNYNYLYENVEWPETDLSKLHSSDSHYYFSSIASEIDVNVAESGSKKHLTDCTNKYQIFKNSLQYIPTESETRNFDAGYQEVPRTKWSGNSQIYFRFLGDLFVWNNTNSMKVASQDKTAIYVVNYKYFLDSLKSNLERYSEDLTVENARNGYLCSILSALSDAAAFNPLDETKYPYSSTTFAYTDVKGNEAVGMEAATRKCGDDIDAIVDCLGSADIDDVDAQYENLVVALNAYEEKMAQQTVYTNMAEAYETYCLGRKYADSYYYGERNDFTPTLQTIAYNLEKQTKAMKAVGKNAYNNYPGQGFDGDLDSEVKTDAYKAAYQNLVYASTAPTRTRDAAFPQTTSAPAATFTRKTNNTSLEDGVLGLYRYCSTGSLTGSGYDTGSTTYLYVPDVVGVYDGVSGAINVPVLLGFRASGGWTGLLTNPYHYTLWSYSSDTAALPFAYPYWKTRKYTAGDAGKYDNNNTDQMGSRTNAYSSDGVTFIETANLNQILNGSRIADSPDVISTNPSTAISSLYSSGYYSNTRSDNKSEAPNPENYYFNAITLTKPNFTGANWKKYMYEYTTLTTRMRSNSVRQDSAGTSTSTSTSADTAYGSYSGTINTLSMWVIDYSGVQAIIDANSGILTDEALMVKQYSEGSLLGFFQDMDKLTACSPVNAKYEYDNDNYVNDVPSSTLKGFAAATEQCAYDIWRLLEAGDEDEKVQYLDDNGMKIDDEYIDIKEDLKNEVNYVDGTYDDLRTALELDPASEVGPCVGNEGDVDYWAVYDAAKAEGAQEMYNVSNYIADGTYEGYITDAADNTIETTAQKITAAYEDLLAHSEQTRHGYVYSGIENDKYENFTRVNYFECGLVPTHDIHLHDGEGANAIPYNYAEMELYENLEIAYNTIDPTKYNNPKILTDGKEKFDLATATADELGTAAVKARQGMKAQDIVDTAVIELLTAINVENGLLEGDDGLTTDKRVNHYSVKFNVVNTKTGTVTDLTDTVIDTESDSVEIEDDGTIKVPYGYELHADASAIAGENECTGWEIKVGAGETKRLDVSVKSLLHYVLNDVVITAYYTPKAAADERTVTIAGIYGYQLYEVNVPAGATVTISRDDLNTVMVNGKAYNVPNGLQQTITGWKYNGTEYRPGSDENLISLTADANIYLKPIAPVIPVNGPYTISLDNTPISTATYEYDDVVTVTSNVEGCYAIAVYADGQYIPVAYGNTFKFYANSGMTNFYTVVQSSNEGEANTDGMPLYSYTVMGADITDTFNEEQIFLLRGNMPMANSIAEKTFDDGETLKFTARSQFSVNIGNAMFNNGLHVTEVGTLYFTDESGSLDAAAVKEGLTLDNLGSTDFLVKKKTSSVLDYADQFSNQYSLTIKNSSNKKLYARAYVKYEYRFTDPSNPENGAVISAVYYGNVVNMFDAN